MAFGHCFDSISTGASAYVSVAEWGNNTSASNATIDGLAQGIHFEQQGTQVSGTNKAETWFPIMNIIQFIIFQFLKKSTILKRGGSQNEQK